MEKQLRKLIEDYNDKIETVEKEIDRREDGGVDCFNHYGLLKGYRSALKDLEFLLNFMKEGK